MADSDGATPIERVKARRERLGQAADRLESAITRPAGDESAWRVGAGAAATEVGAALRAHVDEVEASDGLYAEIMSRSPRLAHAIERLRDEHTTLRDEIDEIGSMIASPDTSVDDIRERALGLLTDLSRHRHRGADLIWDSYELDIGEGD